MEKTKPITVGCSYCDKKIEVTTSRKKEHKNLFCSVQCHNEWQRKNTPVGKKCTKCNMVKQIFEFGKDKQKKDGYLSICKACRKEYYISNKLNILKHQKEEYHKNRKEKLDGQKDYYIKNKEKILIKNKMYLEKNKKKIADKAKKYRLKNKGKISKRQKSYYVKNKDKLLKNVKTYREKNKVKLRKIDRNKYIENRQKILDRQKDYYIKNKEKIIRYHEKYWKSMEGKKTNAKSQAKRKRELNWIPVFLNPFPQDIDIEYHHIDKVFVVPIPKKVHRYVGGNASNNKHREYANQWIKNIYCLDIEKLLNV